MTWRSPKDFWYHQHQSNHQTEGPVPTDQWFDSDTIDKHYPKAVAITKAEARRLTEHPWTTLLHQPHPGGLFSTSRVGRTTRFLRAGQGWCHATQWGCWYHKQKVRITCTRTSQWDHIRKPRACPRSVLLFCLAEQKEEPAAGRSPPGNEKSLGILSGYSKDFLHGENPKLWISVLHAHHHSFIIKQPRQ